MIEPVVDRSLAGTDPQEQMMKQIERAGALLAEARTLDQARKVEGFVRATLEWARRQEQITLAARNDATHLWLAAQAVQGELLSQIDRQARGRPEKRSSDERFSATVPTLAELGYKPRQAQILAQIASVPADVRERLTSASTEQGVKLTQKAVLDVARKSSNGSPPPAVEQDRPPCPEPIPWDYANAIVVGDARQLASRLRDHSIGVCFCDPVYDRVEDYEWLARECERVLTPGGSLIVQCGNSRRFECETAMRKSNLAFVDLLAEVYPYAIGRLFKAKVFVGWKPYLWFSKGPRQSGWVMNRAGTAGKNSADPSKELHPWGDSEQFAAALLPHLCSEGDVLWDPFTGSGTVPTVAARLGIPFVAFEIDPTVAEAARRRVTGTAGPITLQPALDFDAAPAKDVPGFTCTVCDQSFTRKVWHCPECGNHWPMKRATCWNCHEGKRPA